MYVINAGSRNGTLDKLNIRTGHETAKDALAALQRHMRGQGHEALVSVQGEDGLYVYLDQNDADRDGDGSRAFAIIEPANAGNSLQNRSELEGHV